METRVHDRISADRIEVSSKFHNSSKVECLNDVFRTQTHVVGVSRLQHRVRKVKHPWRGDLKKKKIVLLEVKSFSYWKKIILPHVFVAAKNDF